MAGIVLLLQAACESWRLAILSFATLCLPLARGWVALATMEPNTKSMGSLFGFLAVFGMAARNQSPVLRELRNSEAGATELSGAQRIMQVLGEQFGSILMTFVSLGMALFPLVFIGDVPGLEVLRPTALVILGGMVTGILMDLFVVPILYLRLSPVGLTRKS